MPGGRNGNSSSKEGKGKDRIGSVAQKEPLLNRWPVIKSKKALSVSYLKGNDLFLVHDFLTAKESNSFIQAAEQLEFSHQGSLGPTMGEAYRDNDRISVTDPGLADMMWQSGLNKLFIDIKIRGKVAVGLNPNIRFYRYNVGQRFGRHIDESVHIGDQKRTYYTLLVYLSGTSKFRCSGDASFQDDSSGELLGGETVFYGPRNNIVAEVSPVAGLALFHIHGDKCMLHEARNVLKGVKYVFRSDVAFA